MRDNEQKSDDVAAVLASLITGPSNAPRVLDVGCGNGTVLAACAMGARSLTGIDLDAQLVSQAKDRLPDADLRVASIADGLPFSDGSFDAIFFCDVIEHLRAPVDALRELSRLLAHDGRLLITTPNVGSPIRRLRGDRWFGLQDPSHLYFFDRFTLGHLASKAQLVPRRITTFAFSGNARFDWLIERFRAGGTLAMIAAPASTR